MRKFFALILAVLILGSLATVAFASDTGDSPVGKPEFKIEIYYDFETPELGGTVIITGPEGSDHSDPYILTPKEKEGYEFDTYVIEGDYEIVSKDGDKWTIIAHGNLVVHVKYKGVETKPTPHDDKPVSPNTGDNTMMFILVMALGICGVVLASRKLLRNR